MKVHGLGDQNQPCTPEEPILETIRSSARHRPLTLDYLVLHRTKTRQSQCLCTARKRRCAPLHFILWYMLYKIIHSIYLRLHKVFTGSDNEFLISFYAGRSSRTSKKASQFGGDFLTKQKTIPP